MSIEFKGRWFEKEVILQCVRWYVAYPLSYRQIEEMMKERGVDVDHSTINRWVVKYAPELEKEFRNRKKRAGSSWRVDETYVKVKGQWKYLYRAVDKEGATIDFLLTACRDSLAAYRFFEKAIGSSGLPVKINIDKSGANKAAVDKLNRRQRQRKKRQIILRQVKYLNNIIEQDHRGPKRVIGPTLGFKSFPTAQNTIAGIELMHMIRKGQMNNTQSLTPAEQFYDLAG
jgi:transposase-like protein